VGGRLQRELGGFHSARRGAYKVVYEIHDEEHAVIVLRIDHRSRVYRSR
jgi:mRNA-degrading endonuclease RelE of RelBE toxin-antitoxin system